MPKSTKKLTNYVDSSSQIEAPKKIREKYNLLTNLIDEHTFCGGGVELEIVADLSWMILDSEKQKLKRKERWNNFQMTTLSNADN